MAWRRRDEAEEKLCFACQTLVQAAKHNNMREGGNTIIIIINITEYFQENNTYLLTYLFPI